LLARSNGTIGNMPAGHRGLSGIIEICRC